MLNKRQCIDLSMIDQRHIVTRWADELFILLYLHNERRLRIIQSFTTKPLDCRCILHIKTMTETTAKDLLRRFTKWFNIRSVDYRRVCAYGKVGEYNNMKESYTLTPPSSIITSTGQWSIHGSASPAYTVVTSSSSSYTTPIPYKRSSTDNNGRRTNLLTFSGQQSLHQRSSNSMSEDVKPPFLRSISSPNQHELDKCRSIGL